MKQKEFLAWLVDMHTKGRDSTIAKIKKRPNYYKEVEEKVSSLATASY